MYVFRKQSSVLSAGKSQKESAASTIQQHWRRRQARLKQERYQRESEDAIINLQSTLKAHLARKKVISSHPLPPSPSPSPPPPPAVTEEVLDGGEESSDSSEAIQLVQSALRGYLTRQMALQDLKRKRCVP